MYECTSTKDGSHHTDVNKQERMPLLTDLPPELLSSLVSNIQGKYLAAVAQTCKLLYNCVQIESVWRRRCIEEFGVHNVDSEVISWKDAYTKLLYSYSYTLGLWQAVVTHYGGLLHVKFSESRIEGTEYLAPPAPHVRQPLRSDPLFTIELDSSGQRKYVCRRGYQSHRHPVCISQLPSNHQSRDIVQGDSMLLRYHCKQINHHPHQSHPDGPRAVLQEWLSKEIGNPILDMEDLHGHELSIMKFMVLLQFEYEKQFVKITMPSVPSYVVPICPGLFKGTYGGHGVEVISLRYTDDKKAEAVKITGDPNIPSSKWTIRADLNRTMILTHEQQNSISLLRDIDTPDIPPSTTMARLTSQPFCVPADCTERFDDIPRICKYRCHSQGQVAGHGYTSPTSIAGHWVVFDENTFGHIWINLKSLSIYSRVTEVLSS